MKTWIAAAAALALLSGLAAAQDGDPAGKIEKLIQQLGSEDYATREKATEELRKIGTPAREALRKAAENPDPEVQTRARSLLQEIEKPRESEKSRDDVVPRRVPRAGQGFNFGPGFNLQGLAGGSVAVMSNNGDTTYQVSPADGSAPFTFHRSAAGAVKLEYTDDKGEKKTAESESLAKFLKDHKALAEKYGIGEDGINYAGLRAGFGRGAQQAFQLQPRFQFRVPALPGDDRDEDDLPAWPFAQAPQGERAAGATLEKPSDTLRAQLEIPEGQGLVVTRVAAGSAAESAGLRRHDILLEIDGQKVGTSREVKDLLKKAKSLTVLRKGRKQTLQPQAPEKVERKDF